MGPFFLLARDNERRWWNLLKMKNLKMTNLLHVTQRAGSQYKDKKCIHIVHLYMSSLGSPEKIYTIYSPWPGIQFIK